MSEYRDEPVMRVPLSNGEFHEATRDNTKLFTFLGYTALNGVEMDSDDFNHIFTVTRSDDETEFGTYIFATDPITGEEQPIFAQMLKYMAAHRYPMRLNEPYVPDCDKEAYLRHRENCIEKAVENLNFDELLDDGTPEA